MAPSVAKFPWEQSGPMMCWSQVIWRETDGSWKRTNQVTILSAIRRSSWSLNLAWVTANQWSVQLNLLRHLNSFKRWNLTFKLNIYHWAAGFALVQSDALQMKTTKLLHRTGDQWAHINTQWRPGMTDLVWLQPSNDQHISRRRAASAPASHRQLTTDCRKI